MSFKSTTSLKQVQAFSHLKVPSALKDGMMASLLRENYNEVFKACEDLVGCYRGRSRLKVFNHALMWISRGKHELSQVEMGKILGYNRGTVAGALDELESLGLLRREGQKPGKWNNWKPCLYFLNPAFRSYEIRSKFATLFKRFTLPIFYLWLGDGAATYRHIPKKPALSYATRVNIPRVSRTYNRKREFSGHGHGVRPGIFKKGFQKGEEEKKMVQRLVTPGLRKATEVLGLTKWGQIKMMAFSDAIINQALSLTTRATSVRDPFKYFMKTANTLCKERGIRPEWNRVDFLVKNYKMPDDAPMTLPPDPEKVKSVSARPRQQWKSTTVEIKEELYVILEKWEKQAALGPIAFGEFKNAVSNSLLGWDEEPVEEMAILRLKWPAFEEDFEKIARKYHEKRNCVPKGERSISNRE